MRTIQWDDENVCISLIDQTRLPEEVTRYRVKTVEDLVDSIRRLRVRGAPALGAAGGYGVVLAAHQSDDRTLLELSETLREESERIANARPTAVNLSRGVKRVLEEALSGETVPGVRQRARAEAEALAREDIEVNRRIGEHGAKLLQSNQTVMTHCNAGSFATVEWGTALGIVYTAEERGMDLRVITNETRPLNQGSRITTAELMEHRVETTLITDNASGLCMESGEVDAVIVGADRVVLEGGEKYKHQAVVFNKIGTYNHAVIADRHGIPFVVAVPTSTVDAESTADEV